MTLAVVLTIAVAQLQSSPSQTQAQPPRLTQAQIRAQLRGSPPALAALHAKAGELLAGTGGAWRAQLRALHGWPVVVNKWASWCVPCQGEREVFQRATASWGKRVAFLGLDSGDTSEGDARAFMAATPMSYPSYYDASGALGRAATDSSFTPVTVFLTSSGGRFIHQGPYTSVAALERDIRRYAARA